MGCGASAPTAVMKPQDEQAATLLQESPPDVKATKPEEPKVEASACEGEGASKQTLAAEVISIEKEVPRVIAPETSEPQQEVEGQVNSEPTPAAEIVATAEEAPQAISLQTSESQQEAEASACVGDDTSKQTPVAEVTSIEKEVPQVIAPETSESQQDVGASACVGEEGSKQTPAAEPVSIAKELPQVISPETLESQQVAEVIATADLVGGTTSEEAGVPKASVEAAGPAVLANSGDCLNHCVGEEAQTEIAVKE